VLSATKGKLHKLLQLGLRADLASVDLSKVEEVFAIGQNPFSIVAPAWDYPPDFTMKPWEEQLAVLQEAYPKLSADGLSEMAQEWLTRKEIWEQSSAHGKTGSVINHYDGLAVFPLPGKAAKKFGLGDLWSDVARGVKGKALWGKQSEGLWGKLCEEVLFPQFAPKFPVPFVNYRKGQMGSDRFLPEDILPSWFQEMESAVSGDFACRPMSFGRRLAGYSVQAARWEIENIIAGISGSSWVTGNTLLAHPDRLPGYGHLWLDCPGDRYRFGDSRGFGSAPYFSRRVGGEFYFYAYGVSYAYAFDGSVFLAR